MNRTIFSLFAGAALIFGGTACERHSASELEEEHGGAPRAMDSGKPAEVPKTHASEGVQTNPAGSGPLSSPKPDKGDQQKAATPAMPKFFPDSK